MYTIANLKLNTTEQTFTAYIEDDVQGMYVEGEYEVYRGVVTVVYIKESGSDGQVLTSGLLVSFLESEISETMSDTEIRESYTLLFKH